MMDLDKICELFEIQNLRIEMLEHELDDLKDHFLRVVRALTEEAISKNEAF